ncbi:hypothetical protein [Tropicibacter sp. S64]|uniref:hypothetical protein n=1 Tax=Tropicibacter sp. S64 TaxID=3415122 RepID=UPI003C7C4498
MRSAVLLGTAALLAASAAQSATTGYTSRPGFEAALGAYTIDTLGDLTSGPGTSLSRTDYTLTGDFYRCVTVSDCGDNSAGSGGIGFEYPGYLWQYTAHTFTFASAITGFGMDFGNNSPYEMTLEIGDQIFSAIPSFSKSFFGILSDTPFTSLTVNVQEFGLAFTRVLADNYTYSAIPASQVPLPATGLLLLGAAAALSGLRRKRV